MSTQNGGENRVWAALDRCLCNHAEANAIMHCAILGIEAGAEGAILYTTFVPCHLPYHVKSM